MFKFRLKNDDLYVCIDQIKRYMSSIVLVLKHFSFLDPEINSGYHLIFLIWKNLNLRYTSQSA